MLAAQKASSVFSGSPGCSRPVRRSGRVRHRAPQYTHRNPQSDKEPRTRSGRCSDRLRLSPPSQCAAVPRSAPRALGPAVFADEATGCVRRDQATRSLRRASYGRASSARPPLAPTTHPLVSVRLSAESTLQTCKIWTPLCLRKLSIGEPARFAWASQRTQA